MGILHSYGVPLCRIILENRSSSTLENVIYAVPEIMEASRIDSIRTVVAVATWYHFQRAIMTLKRNLPIKAQYYALAYEPNGIRRLESTHQMSYSPEPGLHSGVPRNCHRGDDGDQGED